MSNHNCFKVVWLYTILSQFSMWVRDFFDRVTQDVEMEIRKSNIKDLDIILK